MKEDDDAMRTTTPHPRTAGHGAATTHATFGTPSGSHRERKGIRGGKGWVAERTPLPPIAVLLARPVLLIVCALLGALVGFLASDGSGYKAIAAVEFTVDGNDVALVEVEGKTLADRMTTAPIIKRAAAAIQESPEVVRASTTPEWQPGSTLVEVTAVAPTPTEAWTMANALVEATVADYRDDVGRRLDDATADANSLIAERALANPDAESARRAQVGTSLGDRQNALTERSESITIARKATEAISAGLTPGMGAAIGLAAGLFLGCLIALFLGSRGLRTWSLSSLRRLAPDVDMFTAAQLPRLAGELAENGESAIAVVVPRDSGVVGQNLVGDLERLLSLHGRNATTIHLPVSADQASEALLRSGGSGRTRERSGADTLLVVVEDRSEAASVLQGRSGFRTIVMMRGFKSSVSDALAATKAYGPSRPALVLTH